MNTKILKQAIIDISEEFDTVAKNTILYKNFAKHINEIKSILFYTKNISNPQILDVGGGLGVNLLTISSLKINAGLTLIDRFDEYIDGTSMGSFNNVSIERFKKYKVNFIDQDILTNKILPYPDDFFDLVTIIDVVEHFPTHPINVMKEIHRVLKRNGIIIMAAPNLFGITEISKLLRGKHPYMDFNSWIKSHYYSHYREYTILEYKKIISLSGFTLLKSYKSCEDILTRVCNGDKKLLFSFLLILVLIFPCFKSSITIIGSK